MPRIPEAQIQHLIAEYLDNPGAEFLDVVSEHDAIPVYSDLGGTLFLTADGKILCLPADDGELREESSAE